MTSQVGALYPFEWAINHRDPSGSYLGLDFHRQTNKHTQTIAAFITVLYRILPFSRFEISEELTKHEVGSCSLTKFMDFLQILQNICSVF